MDPCLNILFVLLLLTLQIPNLLYHRFIGTAEHIKIDLIFQVILWLCNLRDQILFVKSPTRLLQLIEISFSFPEISPIKDEHTRQPDDQNKRRVVFPHANDKKIKKQQYDACHLSQNSRQPVSDIVCEIQT